MSMSIPGFSIKQPVFVNLLMLLVIGAGLVALMRMSKEEWPQIPVPTITITTIYQGAAPNEIEQFITKPIEEELLDLDDVDNIDSFSMEGRSYINVNFDAEIENIDSKLTEVENAVSRVSGLPADAEDPLVERFETPISLIDIGLVGGNDEHALLKIAEEMQYDLKKVTGVKDVSMTGNRERQIWVEVDPDRLEMYNLTLGDIMRAIEGKNLNLPGGTLKRGPFEFILRTVGQLRTPEEVGGIVVKENEQGGHIYLRDIAGVSDTFEEPTMIVRINGRRGISLVVTQTETSNMLDIVPKVKRVALSYRKRLTDGAELLLTNDNSRYLLKRLNILNTSGMSGFFLVLIILFLFIGTRPALMTALGIPVALCGCILLMQLASISINSLSLFAMIIVLGMIVDDAIVVTENIYRYIEEGVPVAQAALRGANEVFWPIMAAVSTTMAAFLPMLLMTGPLGKVMSVIPMVVVFALVASVWEAFLILPSHITEFGRPSGKRRYRGAESSWFKVLMDGYTALLRRVIAMRYRAVAMLFAFAALVLAFALGTLNFVLFPNPDFDWLILKVNGDASFRIEETEELAVAAEGCAYQLNDGELLSVKSTVGMHRMTILPEFGSNLVEVSIRLSDYLDRVRSGPQIVADLRERLSKLPQAEAYTLEVLRMGPPLGRPVDVKVLGDNFNILRRIAAQVMDELGRIKGVTDIESDYRPGKQELRVVVDEAKAALYNLTVDMIAITVQRAFMGGVATEFRGRDDEIDIIVKLDADTRRDPNAIRELKIRNRSGALVPLKNVAAIVFARGQAKIRRYEQKRAITINAEISQGVSTSRIVNLELEKRMENFMNQHPEYRLDLGGEFEETGKSLVSLFQAFGLAVFLIYMILATMFRSFIQPLMLMIAIPFAVIGVFVGLIVMRYPMGMMSFLGIIALAGIVVNDSIVLIDFINRHMAQEADPAGRLERLIAACRLRLRPVLLTSITTIVGLLPIALGIFGREFMMTPMAISIVWGLCLSSTLTLFIIPCFYLIVEDAKGFFLRGKRPQND